MKVMKFKKIDKGEYIGESKDVMDDMSSSHNKREIETLSNILKTVGKTGTPGDQAKRIGMKRSSLQIKNTKR